MFTYSFLGQGQVKTEGLRWLFITTAAVSLIFLFGWGVPLDAPFIFDDGGSIHENSSIRSLVDPPSVWIPPGSGRTVQGRPLLNVSLALNYAFVSLEPRWYRITNLLIHGINTLLCFGITSLLLQSERISTSLRVRRYPIASGTAIVWACHPIGTNVVTYVVQRAESLACMGLLFSVLLYLLANLCNESSVPKRIHSSSYLLGGSVLCAFATSLSKETALIIPVVIVSIDYMLFPSRLALYRSRLSIYWGALLSASIFSTIAMLWFSGGRSGTVGSGRVSSAQYLFGQGEIILRYVFGFITADVRIFDFGQLPPVSVRGWICFLILSMITCVSFASFWWRRSMVAGAVIAMLITLGPTSSFIPVQTQAGIFHRFYLASAILSMLLTVGIFGVTTRLTLGKRFPGFIIATVAAFFLWNTRVRNQDYREPVVVWRKCFEQWPWSSIAVSALTRDAAEKGDWTEVDRINQRYSQAVGSDLGTKLNLAQVHYELGDVSTALSILKELSGLYPDDASVQNDLSLYLRESGDFAGAVDAINAALRLRENEARFYVNRGEIYRRLDRPHLVTEDFSTAIRLDDENEDAFFSLGSFWIDQKKPDLAEPCLKRAIELRANYHEAMYWLAVILVSRGNLAEAEKWSMESLRYSQRQPYVELRERIALLQKSSPLENGGQR
jgi:protein O-mannosyl-transferase